MPTEILLGLLISLSLLLGAATLVVRARRVAARAGH